MLSQIAEGLRASLGIRGDDLLLDDELAGLAVRQGLYVSSEDFLPPVVGFYADRRLYLRSGLGRPEWRAVMACMVARAALYGAGDAALIQEVPQSWDQVKGRATILGGYILFGPGMHVDLDPGEAAEVASLADVPPWFVLVWSSLARRADAMSELWKDPELGRRVRRLAERKGLSLG